MSNLFGTDWIALFDLWELPVNSFSTKSERGSKSKIWKKKKKKKKKKKNENFFSDFKNEYPYVFSEGLLYEPLNDLLKKG